MTFSRSIADPRLAAFVASLAHDTWGMVANSRGELHLATEHHSRALALRRDVDFTLGACISLENLGEIARSKGDDHVALGHYREALAIAVEHWNPPIVADTITIAAKIALALGQPERAARLLGAVDALRRAVGIAVSMQSDRVAFEEMVAAARETLGDAAYDSAWNEGSGYTLDVAIAEVDRIVSPSEILGPDDRQSVAEARYGLTQREVDVLRGIVERLTDREIADRLFISPRTVGWHVTGILAKLNVDSRRAAAAKAIAESLT
jgi:DNA-binding CsgD family transcriptional regulator